VGGTASVTWNSGTGGGSNGAEDLSHALWLMRLSYIRYALKTSTDPQKLFEQESEELRLSPCFKFLFEPFVPKTANHASAEPLSV
jgi:hypothetical protein